MNQDLSHIRFISAGAGSGKTYFLTGKLEQALVEENVKPGGIMATTFTVKAAGELEQRVRQRLIRNGRTQLAEQIGQALIGTVHGVCERLLKRFAFELGLSPQLNVASLEDTADFFRAALDDVLDSRRIRRMNALAYRLGIESWQQVVRDIADMGRGNNLDADALRTNGVASADSLLAEFPAPATIDLDARFKTAIQKAIDDIDREFDTTKATRQYVEGLQSALNELNERNCAWKVWYRLSTATAAKKSDSEAASVREAAHFKSHSRLHGDIRAFTEDVFNIAADALDSFQASKRALGLIDFTDMEQLTLTVLDNPVVRARIRDELELLLVDEFQDTNPMQLSIFMKLARLAKDVVFVGDVKQAIYAFRGCDTALVFDTLTGITSKGGSMDVLPKSYRSRPPLVSYVNHLFTHVFAGVIPEPQIVLQPDRVEQTGAAAVCHWELTGRNAEHRWSALARGIAGLVNNRYPVIDPETSGPRPVQWGDIAVLAATNKHVEKIALALREARIPMRMTLSGLLKVPEVCLVRACLRRLDDDDDTLATAEIVALASGQPPDAWLSDRLRWLAEEKNSRAWAQATDPIVAKLAAMRGEMEHLSPLEIVARVSNTTTIREVITGWGRDENKAAQRHRNLDAFLNLAVEYENHAATRHEAATLTGFLFWLENPRSPELDLQPTVTTGNAVHVLTHHRAKGMEWPVVVAADFDYSWRSRLWDVRAESDGEMNIDAPLASRRLRYWPNIFGKNKPSFRETLETSAYGQRCAEESQGENRRLAYVAMTRARDLLVIPMPDKGVKETAWVEALSAPFLRPEGETLTLPGGQQIPTAYSKLEVIEVPPDPLPYAPCWFPAREAQAETAPESLSPSQMPLDEQAVVTQQIPIGDRLELNGATDMTIVGNALHAIVAGEIVNPAHADALTVAESILHEAGLANTIRAADAAAAAARFGEFARSQWNARRIVAEYPVQQRLDNGQVVRGWIDALVETDDGWIVVDHKSSPRPRSAWEEEALGYSGQLKAYRDALDAAGLRTAGTWIHFPVSGGMVEVASR